MARIAVNTTGKQPTIQISTDSAFTAANLLTLPFVQDLTVTNSNGVYSYTTFSDIDVRKLSTPADNAISTNVVIDSDAYFGTDGAAGSAKATGLQALASNKTPIYVRVFWSSSTATPSGQFRSGVGFITNLAPTVTPTEPVWVTPLEIAVDGGYTDGVV